MIKTKSIYEPKSHDDGYRILITRYYPRGVKKEHFDEWIRELAPSPELLKFYKDGSVDWNEFTQEFFIQMDSNIESLEMIDSLAELSKEKNVTLLCYEKTGNPCHRYLIENMIRGQMGSELEMLTKIS